MNSLLLCITLVKIKTFSKFFGPFLTYIYIGGYIVVFCSKLCYLGNIQEASEFASTQNGCLDFSLSIMKRIQNIPGFFFNFLHPFSILLVRLTCTFYSFQIYMAFSGLAFLLKKKNFDFLSRKKNPALTMGYSVTL